MSERRASSPWGETQDAARPGDHLPGGAGFGELVDAVRELTAAVAGSDLPSEHSAGVARRLQQLAEEVRGFAVPELHRVDGRRHDLPGRGHPGLPPYVVDVAERGLVRGRVTFSRAHLGGNAAVHGGVPPLLFDDVLGAVANLGFEGTARTAFLTTNYRAVTPLDVELGFEASLDRVEGRKRWATGRLFGPDGTVLVDAESLFVALLPGQP